MAKKKGDPKTGGRKKGSQNKLTKTVKDVVLMTFNKLQGDPKANMYAWGKANPKEFYQVAAKLIPSEIHAKVDPESIKRHTIILPDGTAIEI